MINNSNANISSPNRHNNNTKFSSLPNNTRKNQNSIAITHWNCNSIGNKLEILKYYIIENQPDIISLNETKVNDQLANYFFSQLLHLLYIKIDKTDKVVV
jgi:hypothetical protein